MRDAAAAFFFNPPHPRHPVYSAVCWSPFSSWSIATAFTLNGLCSSFYAPFKS